MHRADIEKRKKNAKAVERLKVGDRICVKKSGLLGTVMRFNRYSNPRYDYSTVTVCLDSTNKCRCYSGASLKKVKEAK